MTETQEVLSDCRDVSLCLQKLKPGRGHMLGLFLVFNFERWHHQSTPVDRAHTNSHTYTEPWATSENNLESVSFSVMLTQSGQVESSQVELGGIKWSGVECTGLQYWTVSAARGYSCWSLEGQTWISLSPPTTEVPCSCSCPSSLVKHKEGSLYDTDRDFLISLWLEINFTQKEAFYPPSPPKQTCRIMKRSVNVHYEQEERLQKTCFTVHLDTWLLF